MGPGPGGAFSRDRRSKENFERRWALRTAMKERVLKSVGQEQTATKYLWFPKRCPKTKRWFWLTTATLREVSAYGVSDVGTELWPTLKWKLVEIQKSEKNEAN